MCKSKSADYFIVGVDSIYQLEKILDAEISHELNFDLGTLNFNKSCLDPRNWRK